MVSKSTMILLFIFLGPFSARAAFDSTFDKIHEKYKNVHTLTAKFIQIQKKITLGQTIESSGMISIKLPKMFRWETMEPASERSILVSDGRMVWYYTPPFNKNEKGKLMKRPAADVQSQLAIDLLSGRSDFKKSFKISKLSQIGVYKLIPLKASGDIEHMELFVEPETYLVYKLTLFTSIGNKTELELKKVTLDSAVDSSLFHFSPPKGTEEIQ